MARIRTVKPGFFTSLPIAELQDDSTRLHFIGLWTYADDEGRGIDDGRLLKAALWALHERKTVKVIERMQSNLSQLGRIVRYEVASRRYFQIVNWKEHQKIDRPQTSILPSLEEGKIVEDSTNDQRTRDEDSLLEGNGGEWSRKGGESSSHSRSDLQANARRIDDDDDPPEWALIEANHRLLLRPAHLPVVLDPAAWLHSTAIDIARTGPVETDDERHLRIAEEAIARVKGEAS